jgi:hypothetical protein
MLDHSPLTVFGKRKLIGNAVPLPMADAIASAVVAAIADCGFDDPIDGDEHEHDCVEPI